MSQVIVFWSQTGNTESIANKIKGDLGCDMFAVQDANVNDILKFDTIILGCPAMGSEELEDSEFRPFFDELKEKAKNKNVLLFGSYGWGGNGPKWLNGKMEEAGFEMIDNLEINYVPDDEDLEKCFDLGVKVAQELKKI